MSESGELVDDKRAAEKLTPENREPPERRKHRPPKGGMDNPMSVSEKWLLMDLTAVFCTTSRRTQMAHPDVVQKYVERLHILDMPRLFEWAYGGFGAYVGLGPKVG